VCEAICRELIDNTTAGRQALVGSAWWAPLPVLVRLPLAALFEGEAGPVASVLVSIFFGVAILFLLNGILRGWGIGWPRWLIAAGLALHPAFLRACFDGSSGTMALFLVLLSAHNLAQWLAQKKLRYLIVLALATALLVATSVELAPWALLVLLLLALDQVVAPSKRWYKEAVLILGFFPTLYTVGLWMLLNWLVMGDALYFVRSFAASAGRDVGAASLVPIGVMHGASAGVSLLLVIVALMRKSGAGISLGILGFSPLVLALLMGANGLSWAGGPVLLCLFPLAVLSAAYAVTMSGTLARPAAVAVAVAVLATSGMAFMQRGEIRPLARGEGYSRTTEQNRWLPMIERHVANRSHYPQVFVCGYDSFTLLGSYANPVFVRSMDFNFNKAKQDYPGRDLFVLVHRPRARSGMDSVHWKYPRIFELGSHTTLYDGDFGDWRLFEIVQAPRE